MKKTLIFSSCILALLTIIAVSCQNSVAKTEAASSDSTAKRIEHGRYLVTIMGCNDCHTPLKMGPMGPEPDMDRMLSGHPSSFPMPKIDTGALKDFVLFTHTSTAMIGPWGISYTANLTSDSTGIGAWSFEQFRNVFTKGKAKGIETNRDILPPMPWRNYVNMNESDMRDIFAFLKSTKPVHNVVPQPVIAPPPPALAKR
jgi:hypothetical protein